MGMATASGRFWSKVEKTAGCWRWRGYTRPDGYGQFHFWGKTHLVHRLAYELTKRETIKGLRLAQRCGVKKCVNPAHLILAFWLRIDRNGDCHLWTGKQRRGQGRMKFRGRQINPRRLAYMLSIGRIPDGEPVSNTCRNGLCCRPEHLKLGKNQRRARPGTAPDLEDWT